MVGPAGSASWLNSAGDFKSESSLQRSGIDPSLYKRLNYAKEMLNKMGSELGHLEKLPISNEPLLRPLSGFHPPPKLTPGTTRHSGG